MSRINPTQALKTLNDKFGEKFDFSKFVYTKSHDKSIVICKKCGKEFKMSYTDLMRGHGCKYCKFDKLKQLYIKSTDEFVEDIKKVHGDKFTVLGEYKGNKIPIKVRCNDCGYEFSPQPVNIVNGGQELFIKNLIKTNNFYYLT